MTSRCSRSRSGNFSIAMALSLLFTVALGLAPMVVAQDTPGGSAKPPQGGAPDADFGVMQGQPPGDWNNDGPPMRKRRMRQGFGGDGAFGGGGQFGGGQFGGGRRGGMAGGGHRALDLTPLNLNDEQKSRIQQIRQTTRERARTAKKSLVEKQLQLRDLLFSADASDAKIRAARKEVRQSQEQLDDLNIEDLLKIRSVLTAEQKQKLPELKPNMQGGRGMAGRAGMGGAPGMAGGRAQLGDRPAAGR
jgi:Spy/CpxP family protein refolding chaperone